MENYRNIYQGYINIKKNMIIQANLQKKKELNSLSSQINSFKLDKNKIKAKIENKGLYKRHINKIQQSMKKYIYINLLNYMLLNPYVKTIWKD